MQVVITEYSDMLLGLHIEMMHFICRVLREAKEATEMQCELWRRKFEKLSDEFAMLNRELTASCSAKDSEAAELRSQLKIKSFEHTSMAINYEVCVN